MTPAEALARWTGRMGLRKAKGRRCRCWLEGERCNWVGRRPHKTKEGRSFCQPPGIAHASVWGLGAPPAFKELRLLVSQPALLEIDEAALEEWCDRQKVVCWARPELSWHQPGATTLQVFVSPAALAKLAAGDSCPSCRAAGRWAERTCCGVGDLAAWWDAQAVAEALMRQEV